MPGFRPIRTSGSGAWTLVCSQDRESLGEKKRNSLPCTVIPHPAELDRASLRSIGGSGKMTTASSPVARHLARHFIYIVLFRSHKNLQGRYFITHISQRKKPSWERLGSLPKYYSWWRAEFAFQHQVCLFSKAYVLPPTLNFLFWNISNLQKSWNIIETWNKHSYILHLESPADSSLCFMPQHHPNSSKVLVGIWLV